MPAPLGIQIDADAQRLLSRFARLAPAGRRGMLRRLRARLLILEGEVLRKADLRWRRGNAGLAGRLTSRAEGHAELGVDAAIGFRRRRGFPYELAQEFGARAKPGKAMSIPLTAKAQAAGGASRYPGRLVLVRSGGQALLFPAGKRGAQGAPAYVLKRSIPPRLNFRRTVMGAAGKLSAAIVDGYHEGMESV